MSLNQRKIGVILTYASELIKILSALLYTPIMLSILGQSEYGIYQLVYSVVSYLGLLSLGFGSSYMKFYSQKKSENDENGIASLNGMFMTIFCLISLVCIFCGYIMILNIHKLFGNSLNEEEYVIARILMSFMVLNLAITFPNSVFDCNLIAHEEFFFQKILTLIQSLLNPLLSIPLLLLGFGSIGMVCISTFLTISVFITNIYYSIKKLNMKFNFKKFDFLLFRKMSSFTFFIFISQIIDQINWNLDKFLLGRLIGTSAVAIYSVGGQINSLYLQFSTAISNVFIPTVNNMVAKNKGNNALTDLFIKVGRIQFFVMMLILSGFIIVGKKFIEIWAGTDYIEAYYVTLLLIIPVTIPLTQNLGIEIQRAKNLHKSRSLVYFFISIMNIFISIPLIKRLGTSGAALGTAISLFLGNIVFINFYYQYKVGLNILLFWKNILKIAPSISLPFIIGMFVNFIVKIQSIKQILVFAIGYSIIYFCSVYFIGLNESEKYIVKNFLNKFKRKKGDVKYDRL